MREAIFEAGEVDARTAVTVCLADAAELLPHTFGKKDLKGAKKRLKAISDGDAVAGAAKDAISAMQTAVMVAAIMPAITASTTAAIVS